jgi:drug/metabolite transporter (DMT)-like permease
MVCARRASHTNSATLSVNDHHRPVVGVLLKLSSVVLLSCLAACVKYLGDGVPTGQIIFVRGVIALPVLALLAWRVDGLRVLRTDRLRSHATRSLAGTASMFCWFTALTLLPLADFTAISFTAPMFLTVLAMVLLGERIHAYRWTALAIGFVGVAVTIAPHLTFGGSSFGLLVAFGAAVFSALAITTLRSMSGSGGEHPLAITFYFSLTTVICSAATALWGWPMPTGEQWAFIVLAATFGVFGQLLMTMSYRYAEASTLAPLDYTNLLLAVAFGFYFFDEVPHWSMWVGAPLVIAAGLIILWREYRRYAAVPAPVVPND